VSIVKTVRCVIIGFSAEIIPAPIDLRVSLRGVLQL